MDGTMNVLVEAGDVVKTLGILVRNSCLRGSSRLFQCFFISFLNRMLASFWAFKWEAGCGVDANCRR